MAALIDAKRRGPWKPLDGLHFYPVQSGHTRAQHETTHEGRAALNEAALRRRSRGERAPVKRGAPGRRSRRGRGRMSSESRYHPGADMQGFVRELMEFVELGDTDVATIRRTAPVILQHEQALTTALYEHFLKFPA